MADRWYFSWGNEPRLGPFSAAQLMDLAALGRIQPGDSLWKDGAEKGVMAATVEGLFPELHRRASLETFVQVANAAAHPLQPLKGLSPVSPPPSAKLQLLAIPAKDTKTSVELHERIPDGLTLKPEQSNPASLVCAPPGTAATTENVGRQPSHPKKRIPKGRATAVRGAVILNQNGDIARYKKKCAKCGYEDVCCSTTPIKNGLTTGNFFCPKCRRMGEVIIRGTMLSR